MAETGASRAERPRSPAPAGSSAARSAAGWPPRRRGRGLDVDPAAPARVEGDRGRRSSPPTSPTARRSTGRSTAPSWSSTPPPTFASGARWRTSSRSTSAAPRNVLDAAAGRRRGARRPHQLGGRLRLRRPAASRTRPRSAAPTASPTSTPRAPPTGSRCRRGAVVIRPGDVYGPGSVPWTLRPLELARAGPARRARPRRRRDAAALRRRPRRGGRRWRSSGASPGQAYTVWDGEPVTFDEYFDRLARSPAAARRAACRARCSSWRGAIEGSATLRGKPPAFTARAADLRRPPRHGVGGEAREELGWEPRVPYEEGMRRTEEWLRAEGLIWDGPRTPARRAVCVRLECSRLGAPHDPSPPRPRWSSPRWRWRSSRRRRRRRLRPAGRPLAERGRHPHRLLGRAGRRGAAHRGRPRGPVAAIVRFRARRGANPAPLRGRAGRVRAAGGPLVAIAVGMFVFGIVMASKARDVQPTGSEGLGAPSEPGRPGERAQGPVGHQAAGHQRDRPAVAVAVRVSGRAARRPDSSPTTSSWCRSTPRWSSTSPPPTSSTAGSSRRSAVRSTRFPATTPRPGSGPIARASTRASRPTTPGPRTR